MLYFAMGDHPGIGYLTTSPLIGLLAFISRNIFGYSEFGLKLFPALTGAASLIIISLLVRELKGKNLAVIIACFAFIASPAFLRSNALFQPVSFDEFFWLVTFYLIVRMVNTDNPRQWLSIGFILGLAFLTKYSIVFLIAGLSISLAFSPHRRLFQSKYFLYGLFIGILVILPNLLWQYFNNWPVIKHMTELSESQLVHVERSNFLLGQILMNFPVALIWLIGLVSLFIQKDKVKFRFLGYTYVAVLALFILAKGKDYYTLGLYPMLFAAGGVAMENLFIRKLYFINYLILGYAFIFALLLVPLALPALPFNQLEKYCKAISPSINRWEDGTIHKIPQDYADMTGWKELAEDVSKAYNQLDQKEKEKCVIYASNYGEAGAIQFYGHKYGLPKPISFNDSYLLWAPDSISDCPLIYINHEIGDIKDLYNNYPETGRINNEYFRENGVSIRLCTDPKKQWKALYAAKVHRLKSAFRKVNNLPSDITLHR